MGTTISAILLAAGESSRMGSPKPLLIWHDTPLIQYQIDSLVSAGVDEVVVVLGNQAEDVAPYINCKRARYIVNPDYKYGKTSSIIKGLQAIDPSAQSILLLAVDQPRTKDIISSVIHAHLENKALLTSPWYEHKGGHPLIFSSLLRTELENISEENQGIRMVFQAHQNEINMVQICDPLVRLDINTPEDYNQAIIHFTTLSE